MSPSVCVGDIQAAFLAVEEQALERAIEVFLEMDYDAAIATLRSREVSDE